MSSMLSAPATIPATNDGILTTLFAPADPGTVTCSATSRCRPARSASPKTGARPPADTRWGSSKTAETPCETCIYRMPLSVSDAEPSQVPSSLVTGAFVCHGVPPRPTPSGGSRLRSRCG
jgi:hypothetical protein